MAKRVQLPDGNIGEFPDSMSNEQIEGVLQKQFPKQAAAPTEGEQQTPGFFKRLVAPPGPDTGFLESAGATVLGTVPAVYHAFADEPTEEEKKKFGEEETKGLKRVGLGIHRLVVDPITGAHLEDYTSGKITPRAALSVAPAALGVGVGSVAASEAGGRALSKVGQLRTEMGGLRQMGRRVTDVESGLSEEIKSAAKEQGEALEKNKVERAATVKENLEKQRAANTKIDQERLATAEKNKAIEAENRAAQQKVAERKATERVVDRQSVDLGDKIEAVEKGVAKEADAKFKAVREKMGINENNPGPEIPPDHLVNTVRTIEATTLQEIPEAIKEFKAIVEHGGEAPEGQREQFREQTGEEPLGGKPFTWDKLQSLKSRIDARLRNSRRMNGDLKRGLRQLRNEVVETMGGIAEPSGAADLWKDAKDFWRQYKEDFHEPQGPSGSGSPVAKSLDAVDPANIRQPFLGKARSTIGNRAIDILRKYPQHGGHEVATLAENLVKSHDEMIELPKKAAPKALKEIKQAHQMPESRPAPAIPEKPTVDAAQVARDAIAKKAKNWANFNARDVGILGSSVLAGTIMHVLGARGIEAPIMALSYEGLKYGSGRLLNNPKIIEWLAKTPPDEVAVLQKIPGADKVKIINTLTDAAIQASRTGRFGRFRAKYGPSAVGLLSPAAKQLLGPANVARIMGASTGMSTVHNRKDALELMGR